MKIVKKLVEIEVEVLEYTDIAAKMISLQSGDSTVFDVKDFENADLKAELAKALESLGIVEVDELSTEVLLHKNPRHKSLTYTEQWNKEKTQCTITRVQL